MGKAVPKRKLWNAEQVKGSKRVKAEVAIRPDSENDSIPDGISQEAYELMIKGEGQRDLVVLSQCTVKLNSAC